MTSEDSTLDTTVDEWQEEMEKFDKGDSGKTTSELAKEYKIPKSTMQSRLDRLIEARRCIRGTSRRVGASGKTYPVSVYRLKKEEKI